MSKGVIAILIALALAAAGVAFVLLQGGDDGNTETTSQTATTGTAVTQAGGAGSGTNSAVDTSSEDVTVSMIARQFEFEPAVVEVKKGANVTLSIESTDIDHGIAIPQFGVSAPIEKGKTTTVEFTADKAGEFEFMCSVFCGSGHTRMTGTIIVTE